MVWKTTGYFQGAPDTGPGKHILTMVRSDAVPILDLSVAPKLSRYKQYQQNTVLMNRLAFHANAMELPYLKSQSH